MNSNEIRKMARNKLKGKWGKGALFALSFLVILFGLIMILNVFSFTPLMLFGYILYLLVLPPLGFALTVQFLKLSRGEDVNAFDFITWSNINFSKSWKIALHIMKKLLLPVIILILCIFLATFSMITGILSIFEDDSLSTTLQHMGFSAIGWIRIFRMFNLVNCERIFVFLSCLYNGR